MLMPVDTLLHVVGGNAFDLNAKRVLFLNAVYSPSLSVMDSCDLTVQQYFKPYYNTLNESGYTVYSDIPQGNGDYDVVCILVPKSMVEARYLIARGVSLLKSGGQIVCAANNKAGGSRLKKMLQDFGVQDLHDESKNKARAVWGNVPDYHVENINAAINAGEEQDVMAGDFVSQAGVFGWNRVDKGSEILTRYLPDNLKGNGADFGCGYGYLSQFLLSKYPKIRKLHCVDADYRSVELCRKNLINFNQNKEFIWQDLTRRCNELNNLNFIVMNPPFHEGKKTDTSIGHKFIETAHESLSRGGCLWMVANSHLAYENVLESNFSDVKKVHEGQGFKVMSARK